MLSAHLDLIDSVCMPKFLRLHVVHMSYRQAVQGLADVLNVVTLNVPHHHDLCFGLHTSPCSGIALKWALKVNICLNMSIRIVDDCAPQIVCPAAGIKPPKSTAVTTGLPKQHV